jgi:hypothetical protein
MRSVGAGEKSLIPAVQSPFPFRLYETRVRRRCCERRRLPFAPKEMTAVLFWFVRSVSVPVPEWMDCVCVLTVRVD